MDSDPKLDQWIREKGAELEVAFRDAGTPLVPPLTGEMLIRDGLEESDRLLHSPEGQARGSKMMAIAREVAAELPGGYEHPEYSKRVLARLEQVLKEGQDGAGASA